MVSLEKITSQGKVLFLAYDQGLEHGPSDFNDENIDPGYILKIGVEGGYTGIIFQKGVAEKYYTSALWAGDLQGRIPLIVKLNGKTSLVRDNDPFAPLLCSVEEAIALGASAVGYTVYVGSSYENDMTSQLARIVYKAHEKQIPVIAWMYPRGKAVNEKFQTIPGKKELTAYAARIGMELGADIIKLQYPGSLDALTLAVKEAGKTKVVVSGGAKMDEETFLRTARSIMQSGAIGMAIGRNIWQDKDPLSLTKKIKEIVFTK
ncbi:MAG: hypothetical protein HYT10_00930 [Candidatus Levybacteria bacterium]|nr:hypothetical protein [Candidatus Levybacteria bacterium]